VRTMTGRIQAVGAGLVSGRGGISRRVAEASKHNGRAEPFWGSDARGGGGSGGANRRGWVETAALERGGPEGAAQGGAGEGQAGARITFGDDNADGLDCRPAEHEQPGIPGLAAGTAQ
jgi:hypothetical protein